MLESGCNKRPQSSIMSRGGSQRNKWPFFVSKWVRWSTRSNWRLRVWPHHPGFQGNEEKTPLRTRICSLFALFICFLVSTKCFSPTVQQSNNPSPASTFLQCTLQEELACFRKCHVRVRIWSFLPCSVFQPSLPSAWETFGPVSIFPACELFFFSAAVRLVENTESCR